MFSLGVVEGEGGDAGKARLLVGMGTGRKVGVWKVGDDAGGGEGGEGFGELRMIQGEEVEVGDPRP